MVGFNRRFNPLIIEALNRVQKRGPIVTIIGEFHKNLAKKEAEGKLAESVLERFFYETPIHAVDCIRYLAGSEFSHVYGIYNSAISSYCDTFGGLIQFRNGCVAHLIANMTSGSRLERYEIHGNGISIYLEGVTSAKIVDDGNIITLTNNQKDSTFEQDRYFVECISERKPIEAPACDIEEAVKTMELAALIFE